MGCRRLYVVQYSNQTWRTENTDSRVSLRETNFSLITAHMKCKPEFGSCSDKYNVNFRFNFVARKKSKKKKKARIERIEKQLENVSQRGVQAYAHLFSGSS